MLQSCKGIVLLLFNIVHGFTPEQNTALLRRAARALNPGGIVVVAEQVSSRAPGPASGAVAQLLGVGYHHLVGGRIYAQADITGWLNAAGFGRVRRIDLLKTPGNSQFVGTKA